MKIVQQKDKLSHVFRSTSMAPKYKVMTSQTIDTINNLADNGIKKFSVIIRHSERLFSEDASLEPFMVLTDIGKGYASDFGTSIRPNLLPKLFSSFMGRCIETAYLIDKSYTKKNRMDLDHTSIDKMLSPFYVKDIEKAIPLIEKQGNTAFIRNWFDGNFNESIMENPQRTADLLCEFMVEKIKQLKENQIAICVSHDWNIFPIKEFKLGLKHEISGDIGYLEGLIFFEKKGQYYLTNFQTKPVLL
jgi:broad specificity phosphatase PhoE